LSTLLTAISTVPAVSIRASLNFRFLAVYATSEMVATQMMTIGLAICGFGVYSFVIPGVITSLVKVVVFWVKSSNRILPVRSKQIRIMGGRGFSVFCHKLLGS